MVPPIILVLAVSFGAVRAQSGCDTKADVTFLLDNSNNVGPQNFQKQLAFMAGVTNNMQLASDKMQVSAVTFGTGATNQFDLNQYRDTAALQSAINSIPYKGGNAQIANAIHYATGSSFSPLHGGRGDAPHIAVLLTNQPSGTIDTVKLESQTARDNGVILYTVGVGNAVDMNELQAIASDPDSRHIFQAQNFDALGSLTDLLATKICNELPPDPTTLAAPTGCLKKADLVFMVDSSTSVGNTNFQKLEHFLKDVISDIDVSPGQVQVGVVKYGSYPTLEFPLGQHGTRPEAMKAVEAMTYLGGGTNDADAITYTGNQVLDQHNGARGNVPRIAVMITDGGSSNTGAAVAAADKLRQQNVGVLAIGVGNGVSHADLNNLVDSPASENAMWVNSYDNLDSITDQLIKQMCKVNASQPSIATPAPGATLPPDPCQDQEANCAGYGADVCTNYPSWAKTHCARTCGQCTPLYSTQLPQCADVLDTCSTYGSDICAQPYFAQNCQLFCGLCGTNTSQVGYYGKCSYKGHAYSTGETWYDGCEYECICEDGQTGAYKCNNRCPVYHDLPADCTLVTQPGECCLKPVCNYNPTINTQQSSGHGTTPDGIDVCVYKTKQYFQGQRWRDGCDFQCTCDDAKTGRYQCEDLCPSYNSLPPSCHLEQPAGECCQKPVCEYNTQTGSFQGTGSISGNGVGAKPTEHPPCLDALATCSQYGKSVCVNYRGWASSNCRKYCDLCPDELPQPGPDDKCLYDGKSYLQGETWNTTCDTMCICENSIYGYYRCMNTCPTYNNLPADCKLIQKSGECCPVARCDNGVYYSSSTSPNTIGNGATIQVVNPPAGQTQVAPTLSTGGAPRPGTGGTGFSAPSLNGCLYKGQLYVQDQAWEDGCELSCYCKEAGTGLYSCKKKCPTYPDLAPSCKLVTDTNDECCKKPECTPDPVTHQIPVNIPVFLPATQSHGSVDPPNQVDLHTGQYSYTVYLVQTGLTPYPPTVPANVSPHPGGIGYCTYRGVQYLQAQTWSDGCEFSCICDDASKGHYTCTEKCVHYGALPSQCYLVKDPVNPCCDIPKCSFPVNFITHAGEVRTTTDRPLTEFCVYGGQKYQQGQTWYDGCSYKCTCEDAPNNVYRCLTRCPEYENVDESCNYVADPKDPSCCVMPSCPTGSTSSPSLVPTPAPTGTFIGTGLGTGYCEYKGVQYTKGQSWNDGCELNCVCTDAESGLYRCSETCPRYNNLPSYCTLVTDFANTCCKKPRCDTPSVIPTNAPTPGLTSARTPPPPGQTAAPTPPPVLNYCVYKGVQYNQGESWEDGCQYKCRCDDADRGLYTCNERCATYDSVPDGCKMVTSPDDSCCLVPSCQPQPQPTLAPVPGATPTPYVVPTAPPGAVTGSANVPTPKPGQTPTPLSFCEYKGQQYSQGQKWDDGCEFTCECLDAGTGRYKCLEKCTRYVELPPNCVLSRDPANPCCQVPECVDPTPGPAYTPNPNNTPTPKPAPENVCVYKNNYYTQGQTWYDGCDYVCNCEDSQKGLYTCNERCPRYGTLPAECTLVQSSNDPLCCKEPKCTFTNTQNQTTGYLTPPTPPPGVIDGGAATPTPMPTMAPSPGYSPTPGPATTTGPKVCIYKGNMYQQGQKWQDGCQYNCECVDAMSGHYRCTEICPRFDDLPAGCRMITDQFNPCCKKAYCPAANVPTPAPPGVTSAPTPAPKTTGCMYNGVMFKGGEQWNDGCDLQCVCEDEMTGVYRCRDKCNKYEVPAGCTMVTDPRDPCCKVPSCPPPTTQKPYFPGMVPTPAPGFTYSPDKIPTPAPGSTYAPGMFPTYVPGMVPTPAPGFTYAPGKIPTPGPGRTYAPGMYPTYVPGMVPTPAPGFTYAPNKIPTPGPGRTYAPGMYPTYVPGMVPTPMPGMTYAPGKIPTPAPGSTYAPGMYPTWVPGMVPTPAPGFTYAPGKIPTPAPGSTYAPGKYPTYVPGMVPTPAPGFTYPPYLVPTPGPGRTYAPGEFPTPSAYPTPAVGSTYAPYKPGQVPTPAPGKTYAPDVIPTPAPGSTYAPGMFPTFIPGMVPTPAPGSTFAPWLIPGITPAVGSTYAPFKYPTWVPGMVPTPGPGLTFAPGRVPTPGPDGRYPTYIPGMVPTPMPGLTYAPGKIPTPAPGSTYAPGMYPTYVPGMVPTPGPGLTYAPNKVPTPAPGSTFAPGKYPTYVPGMVPTPAPGATYAPNKIPTPAPGSTYAPGMFPTYVPGMVPTPMPGMTYAPGKIPTPAPGSTYAPGMYPTYVPGMVPTPAPGATYAPNKIPTPGPGRTYAPGMYPTYVPGMVPTPMPGMTYAPGKIPTPAPGSTYAPGMYPTWVPGMVPTPAPGFTYAPGKIPTPAPGSTYAPGKYPTYVPGMVPTPAPGFTYPPYLVPTPGPGRTYAPGEFPTPSAYPTPAVGSTYAPYKPGQVPTPAPGKTYAPDVIPTPAPGSTYAPGMFPTFIPGMVPTPAPGSTFAPWLIPGITPAVGSTYAPFKYPTWVPGMVPTPGPGLTFAPGRVPTPGPDGRYPTYIPGMVPTPMPGMTYAPGKIPTPAPGSTYAPGMYPTYVPGMVPTPGPGLTYAPNKVPTPAPGSTYAPGKYPTYVPGMVPTPAPGATYAPNKIPTPAPGSTYAPGMFPTYVPGMVPTPMPGMTYAPGKIPTPAPGSTYAPGMYPTYVPGMVPTPAPGATYAPGKIPTPAPGSTYAPGKYPTYVPGMVPTPAPGATYAPNKIPTPGPGRTYAPGMYPTYVPGMVPTPMPGMTYAPGKIPTPAPGSTYAPGMYPTYVPGMVPTPAPGFTYAPGKIPTPAPGSTYAPGKYPTYVPGMVPTPAPGFTYPPYLVPTPGPGRTYAPGEFPTPSAYPTPAVGSTYAPYKPGQVPTPAPGKTYAPDVIPTPAPGSTYAPGMFPTFIPGMVPTPAPGSTFAPWLIPGITPAVGSTYAPFKYPTWVPGMVPTPGPGLTFAPGRVPTPGPDGRYPTYIPGMVPTPMPGLTYAPGKIPTPAPGRTYAPGMYPTYVPGMVPTPAPGYTYAPNMIPTPGPGMTYAPGKYPTYVPGMVPTPAPGATYAPNKIPTPAPGSTYAPGMFPTYVPGMAPTPAPGYTYAPGKIPTPGPGMTYAPGMFPTYVPGMVPTPAPGFTYAPGKIPTPGPGLTYAPGKYPTYVPGMQPTPGPGRTYAPGRLPTPAPGMTYAPGMFPTPTPNPYPVPTAIPGTFQGTAVGGNGTGCLHYGVIYNEGETWQDGCQYDCECIDYHTGRYQCKERCPLFLNLPSYCRLVVDPNDACCKVPVCQTPAPPTQQPRTPAPQPTPGPGPNPNPTPQPQPTPGPTPRPKEGCVMDGTVYVAGQTWYKGCDQRCVCEDGVTGFYRCYDRCAKYPTIPIGCTLVPDPKDPTCCEVPQCVPVPEPGKTLPTGQPIVVTGVTGVISGSGTPPVPTSGGFTNAPRNVCVYDGRTYAQGQKWQDGCKYDCICTDGMTGKYQCTERCASFPLVPPQCKLQRDPNDVCCFVPVCDYNQTSPAVPNLLSPSPGVPTLPPSYCVYKGVAYRNGQSWDDGCTKKCRCDDADNNVYTCFDRCKSYNNLGAGCVMIADPADQCCQVPQCTYIPTPAPQPGTTLTPPTVCPYPMPTAVPGVISGLPQPDPATGAQPSNVGYCEYKGSQYQQGASWDDGCSYMCTCIDASSGQYQCTEKCPRYVGIPSYCKMAQDPNDKCCTKPACDVCPQTPVPPTGPTPSGMPTPAPKEVCIMNGKQYTEGQKWTVGCEKICVCDDGKTGAYTCNDRCPSYVQQAGCTLVPDQRDPTCCFTPKCPTDVGVYGTINGSGTPPTPGTNPPIIGTGTLAPSPAPVCVYKGKSYTQGQQWQDGCQYDCTCDDAMTGHYMCTDRCPRYPNLPSTCHLVYDPANPCCKKPECGTVTPTPGPGMTPLPVTPGPPAEFCVYQGIPYRQGQSFNKGCDKVCKCEDAMAGKITCTDRCPTYPPLQSNCVLTTDPQDACCQIPTCTSPNGTVIGVPGTVTGTNLPGTNNPITGTRSGCIYNNQVYQQGQLWDDGCKYTCECLDDSTGRYTCTEKCPRLPALPSYCSLTADPNNKCCQVPYCRQPTPGPVGPTAGPTPKPVDVCVYKGSTYKQGQQWYDGCDYTCTCDDASKNFYSCQQRCAKYSSVQQGCRLVPDPKDPTCCQVPNCPIIPPTGPSPTPGIFTVAPQPGGVITGSRPTPPPGSTLPPPYKSGCLYNGNLFYQGQKFDDGCDYECECLNNMTGKYQCTEKCQQVGALPKECILMQDPKKPCCQVPFCDFTNPTPFPGGIPTPGPAVTPSPRPGVITVKPYVVPGITNTPRPGINPSPTPVPPSQTPKPQGYCVYKGVYYTQGQTWDDGCDYTCRCEDVMKGYYTCSQRCPSYAPSSCPMKSDPADQCCLVPDCSGSIPTPIPTPGPGQSTANPIVTPKPISGSFSGNSGGNPVMVNPLPGQQTTGSTPACVYKGSIYTQGQTWHDGCSYNCECIDASRGQYKCDDRCPRYPYLPSNCHFVQSQSDACCKEPKCDIYVQPTNQVPTAPPTSGTTSIVITPGTVCVYFDGTKHAQGSKWQDGCSVDCECVDAGANKFICNQRCPVYSDLPSVCTLVQDPNDPCCMRPVCTLPSGSTLSPLIGNATASPTSLQVLPVGTHAVFTGYGKPTSGSVVGGRNQCVYKGSTHQQGQSWDDGCDYVCTCENATAGMYRCTSKCPDYPQLPSYCKSVKVPGQCCPSITCDIPGYGTYNPTPQLVPTPRPNTPPGGTTPNPYIIKPNPVTPVTGTSLPGGGYYYPNATNPSTGGQLRDKCVYKNRLYNQGETWEDGCDYSCECQDARTGYYVCNPRCPVYNNLPANQCYLVKADGQCCAQPMCYDPDTSKFVNPMTSPSNFPVVGSYSGGFTGFRPSTNGSSAGNRNACVYKGAVHHKGDQWDDGCDFRCTCLDETTGLYQCSVICPTYTNIPPVCRLVDQPGSCCKKLSCTNPGPGITYPPGTTILPPTQPDNDPCQDKLDNCKDYTATACGTAYGDWGARNCARFCKTCQPLYTTPVPRCENKLADCKDYGQTVCTGVYQPWAHDNCALYCGFCNNATQPPSQSTTPTSGTDDCKDLLSTCDLLDKSFYCVGDYFDYGYKNCRKHCNLCSVTTTAATTPTTPATKQWMLFLKGVAGAPGPDLYQLWHSTQTLNPNEPLASHLTSEFNGHYKPDYSNHWNDYCIDQVKVSIYNNGIEKAYIIFNATGADKNSWFTNDRIISSTYTDIKTQPKEIISMAGDASTGREFYISGHTSTADSCSSFGWMMISTKATCFYEAGDSKPTFYYAPGTSQIEWGMTNPGTGDVFAIQAHPSCQPSTGPAGQSTHPPDHTTKAPVCDYKGTQYTQGESWTDGCDYNCTCVDASLGFYRCRDLCSKYTNLPPGCTVHKDPGQCCGVPTCSPGGISTIKPVIIVGGTTFCEYNGQYYAQDETWNIGCSQSCTCTDAVSQRYSCRAVCLRWDNLPSVCHLDMAPPGLCCQQPTCPSYVTISIPTAYKSEYPGNYTYV